ncbi:hypothetical protein QGX11_gp060 [Pseudomonas phage PPSC2]|uniref:Uncharacterized protein n=1 Tax=Pseudomonas phage PPSC2 TaxID=2041350 RepID=A0A2R2YAX9_9CAUD|nr:hypothetical protein QGX11_gp060 [Pseudomonas phage PPSC2]ATN92823.1 hypothetical protein PPSC2_60 [Pseudomonas phage PPSC2]
MTQDQFVYWLQGFVELTETEQPSKAQWAAIKDHLKLVFTKVTPDLGKPLQGPTPPVPFPGYPPLPAERVFPLKPNWLVPEIGKWPPGTVTC